MSYFRRKEARSSSANTGSVSMHDFWRRADVRAMLVTGSYAGKKMGGAEYQTLLLAQGLSKLGHDVAFLATNAGEEETFEAGKFTVIRIPGWRTTGWRRHKQLVAKAIQETAPDLCYVRVFPELGSIVPLCKEVGVPIVSMSCHLMETSPFLLGYYPAEAFAYLRTGLAILHLRSFLSIRSASFHVCNLKSLQRNLQRWYRHKPIRTIHNGSPVPPPPARDRVGASRQVVWVNNLKRWKRPEVFIKLAHRLPRFRFVMIGRKPGGRIYAGRIRAMIQKAPPNFQFLGSQPIDQVNAMIDRSDLLLYTSLPVEGFGNSFLQAWFRGVPTISLSFDLDGILEREGVGRCSRTFEELVADVEELMTDEGTRRNMGIRAREYAIRHHAVDRMVADYEELFKEVVDDSQAFRQTRIK